MKEIEYSGLLFGMAFSPDYMRWIAFRIRYSNTSIQAVDTMLIDATIFIFFHTENLYQSLAFPVRSHQAILLILNGKSDLPTCNFRIRFILKNRKIWPCIN